ncbi:MAG TPA: hypothetical protein VKA03_10355 [Methylovirgula sp.]|nr:hypothetical protein [Methylovirgula sp.]
MRPVANFNGLLMHCGWIMFRIMQRANQSHIVIKIAALNWYKARVRHDESPAQLSATCGVGVVLKVRKVRFGADEVSSS